MATLTDSLIEVRDYLLAEEKRLDARIRECYLSRRDRPGGTGLPFAAPGVADFLFGGWGRYFDDFPEFKDTGTGSGLKGDNYRRFSG